ncbi:hypothetical protein BDV28DRAFT_128389 [Aspergillus coremiiformis]|uniref:Cdc48-dependent protein degradation adaptor protein n=1 Tax=Aspergillus coremiiformis TaxID=138285 RepID=A0A5N6ZFW1_9EURO|nr:hypothetical protein BDV28DRAFT_128389 [Aspergillus coremiiformis]
MEHNPTDQDEVVSQFCAMTSVRPEEAREYLAANGWDLEAAVTEFFAEQDEALQEGNSGASQALGANESAPSASRSLGGSSSQSPSITPQPPSTSRKSAPKKKFATLGDFASGDGDDSEEDDDSVNQDFFAGGEKSGLAVQNPDDIKKKIIEKARRTQVPASDDSAPQRSFFTGPARTLGGDDTPSRVIDVPHAPTPQLQHRVQRTLHFWADGFSVEDGDLYRSDDPRNAEILESIRQGRAPLSIMNVQPGQDVDVEIKQHEEKYVKPKPKYKPFTGAGQRLGSPTPGVRMPSPPTGPAAAGQISSEPAKPNVDESQPVVTLQIRLGDGTRLTSRFNTTHTIGDVYQFVSAAIPDSQSRPWVLMTTFPSKELTDKTAALGDLAEFKRGGVVVQKWQ